MSLIPRVLVVAALAAAPLLCAAPAAAESIWARRHQRSAFLFTDNRARNVGDLLTVVVTEINRVGHNEETRLNKGTAKGLGFFFRAAGEADGVGGEIGAEQDSASSSNRSFDSRARFLSDRTFTDQITVTVIDVLPNGNLVIEGSRKRLVSGEARLLRLTGVVRPDDILFTEEGNFVESRFVADFRIAYEGEGIESEFTRQGWLTRKLNRIWPF